MINRAPKVLWETTDGRFFLGYKVKWDSGKKDPYIGILIRTKKPTEMDKAIALAMVSEAKGATIVG